MWSRLTFAKLAPCRLVSNPRSPLNPLFSSSDVAGRMWRGRCYHRVALFTKKPKAIPLSRLYSVLHTPFVETIHVTCGSSGRVTLKIHDNPNEPASRPLIIHLPSLSSESPVKQVPVPNALLSNTVIQIYPRWSPNHLFPNPIHDILHAYDWIFENLIQQQPHGPHRPIAVYGENLGGTLATSLVLTESRPSRQRPYISALAVKDALFDWSKIASTPPPSNNSDPQDLHLLAQDPALADLYALRSRLFRDPASAFDAFASPLLFFRTTGLAIPASFPTAVSSQAGGAAEAVQSDASAFVSRKSHLTFPPKRSGLRIPITRIGVTGGGSGKGEIKDSKEEGEGEGEGRRKERDKSKGVLKEQAEEMVKLMRRSVVLQEGKERRNAEFDGVAEAERRVTLVELNGKIDDGEWVAEFFDEELGKGEDE